MLASRQLYSPMLAPTPDLPLDTESATRLRTVIGRLARQLRATPAGTEAGLTPTRTVLLLGIDRRGSVRLSELGEAEGLNPTLLSRSVSTLVEDGLVVRTSDDADRRAAWVAPTAAGHALAEAIRTERTEVLNRGLAGLPASQRTIVEQAIPALEALAARLGERTR
jgi:DNA-binding MarR family transcriptional regulator